MFEVEEIDWERRQIVTSDARTLPILELFDALGRPLTSPGGAVVAFAGEPGAWFAFKLQSYERSALQ